MPTTTKTAKKLTPEDYRALAEQAEKQDSADRKQQRQQTVKRLAGVPQRRWATDQHRKVADKQQRAAAQAHKPARPSADEFRERQRRTMIRARNRRRRLPWYPPLASLGIGWVGHGVVLLFSTTAVAPLVPAAVLTALPLLGLLALATTRERRYHRERTHAEQRRQAGQPAAPVEPGHRAWWPEALAGGLGCAGLVFWVALCGLSWLAVLAVLVGTSLASLRWWKANPIGPGVAPLEPPRPVPAPEPAPAPAPVRDEYATAFRGTELGRLTNRTEAEHTIHYDVELTGDSTVSSLLNATEKIAAKLGLDPAQIIIEPAVKNDNGFRPHNRARLGIVTRDVAAGQRYYTGPTVHLADNGSAGVLQNLARFRDGQGEARLTMWNRDGMVSTAIFGSSGGGKSAASNALSCGALSTGLFNSIYVDFKGNSSGALRRRARIVVVGRDAVTDTKRLMKLLTDVRIKNDPRDKQFPTTERPGWFTLLDEITKGIKGDPQFALEMEHMATTVRSLGIWLVATSQDMHSSAWGNTNTRAAFAKQAVVFYMNTSSDQLINGLTYKPSRLPTYDEAEAAPGQEGKPIPGFAVHANTYRDNVPCRWDWLPADDDPTDEEPPYRAGAAFDEFFDEPGIAQDEYDALVNALGEPNEDGQWVIGIGGTHRFGTRDGDDTGNASGGARPVRTSGFGTPRAQQSGNPVEGLPDSQRKVYQVIAGGTTKAGDIEGALDTLGRSTVQSALSSLVGANLIHRAPGRRGEYAIGASSESHQ